MCVELEGVGRCSRGHGDERIGEMEPWRFLLLEVTWLLSREGIANNTLILTAYRDYASHDYFKSDWRVLGN
jgi:hypothetical protein